MKKKRGISTKGLVAALAVTLLIGSAIGGTLAWLTAQTESLVNTFTIGNVAITLTETTGDENHNFKVVPGVPVAKDPKVTVQKNSEACWLFVKIEEKNWSNGLTYDVAEGWKQLKSESTVYYREVDSSETEQEFYVLKDNQVKVKETLSTLGDTPPTLTFTAYAIQKEGIDTAEAAWEKLNPQKP